MRKITWLLIFSIALQAGAQVPVTHSIKFFGAVGDGKTNDQLAFERAAAFFNARHGNGTLLIPAGRYMVGRQVKNLTVKTDYVYRGMDVLHLVQCKDFNIKGMPGSIIRYVDSLKFGTYDPSTGKIFDHGRNAFYDGSYVGAPGNAISLTQCENITIKSLVLDGNNKGLSIGGWYGDVGMQLENIGILIRNSRQIMVDSVNASYFGLDGIEVANDTTIATKPNALVFKNSKFEYNIRQGLSWVGGNDLTAINCDFSQSGRSRFYSPPGAGVDVEAEVGPVNHGRFYKCRFINNTGCGMVADQGNSSDCLFKDCLFWGTTAWTVWVMKPNFRFLDCTFHGSIVWGYTAAKK